MPKQNELNSANTTTLENNIETTANNRPFDNVPRLEKSISELTPHLDSNHQKIDIEVNPISESRRNFLKGILGAGIIASIGGTTAKFMAESFEIKTPKSLKIDPFFSKIGDQIGETLVEKAKDSTIKTEQNNQATWGKFKDFFELRDEEFKSKEARRLADSIKKMNP
jgi:hypothetical protein